MRVFTYRNGQKQSIFAADRTLLRCFQQTVGTNNTADAGGLRKVSDKGVHMWARQ
jgi:hypothetical protein